MKGGSGPGIPREVKQAKSRTQKKKGLKTDKRFPRGRRKKVRGGDRRDTDRSRKEFERPKRREVLTESDDKRKENLLQKGEEEKEDVLGGAR